MQQTKMFWVTVSKPEGSLYQLLCVVHSRALFCPDNLLFKCRAW